MVLQYAFHLFAGPYLKELKDRIKRPKVESFSQVIENEGVRTLFGKFLKYFKFIK